MSRYIKRSLLAIDGSSFERLLTYIEYLEFEFLGSLRREPLLLRSLRITHYKYGDVVIQPSKTVI